MNKKNTCRITFPFVTIVTYQLDELFCIEVIENKTGVTLDKHTELNHIDCQKRVGLLVAHYSDSVI